MNRVGGHIEIDEETETEVRQGGKEQRDERDWEINGEERLKHNSERATERDGRQRRESEGEGCQQLLRQAEKEGSERQIEGEGGRD